VTRSALDRLLPMIQGTMAFTDAFQVPLIIAVIYAVKLSRRWGRAWKGVGVAFAAYAGWVVLTAFLVGFSPSGYVLLTLGTLLDPVDPMWKSISTTRVWVCGVLGTMLLFWAIPTGAAWLLRRRSERACLAAPRPRSWVTPLVAGLILLAAQQLLFRYASRLTQDAQARAVPRIDDGSSTPWGIAAAATLPIIWLLAVGVARWIRQRRAIPSSPT
jgi:hypothetical protein